ncbi:unnamed protein product [Nesidiocoris tenuis]|uniref:Uncharacterized protein n=1 Tax=Nesidiocoris tenuis TaxID=355587 RepID=A0A6H5GR63_9HEMI|nr:unnamed protein product [Nesidiocoris tenuis]
MFQSWRILKTDSDLKRLLTIASFDKRMFHDFPSSFGFFLRQFSSTWLIHLLVVK